MRFFVRILGNMAGIWLASVLVSSIELGKGASTGETLLILALIAVVFTLVNSLIRPVLRFVAFPLYVLTFGLFALVTNAAVFAGAAWLASAFSLPLEVNSFWGALVGGTITAVVASIVVGVLGPETNR